TIEDFTVTFNDPTGVATGLTPAVIHVVDDDDAASSVAYGATIAFPNEGAGSITYTVYRLGDASAALSVPWSAGDCSGQTAAIPGQDYITSSGTLSWAPGETGPKTIALALIDDANFEGIETCAVSINPSYPVTAQYNPVAWFHILDNDGTPTEPTLNIGAGGSVLESAGTINLPVTLTGLQASPYGVSVQYGIEYGTASQNDVSTG